MGLDVVEIEAGRWVIQREDGSEVKSRAHSARSYSFTSREAADATLEYMISPKPVAEAVAEARVNARDEQENHTLWELSQIRHEKTIQARHALAEQIAERHGVQWSEDLGFHVDPAPAYGR